MNVYTGEKWRKEEAGEYNIYLDPNTINRAEQEDAEALDRLLVRMKMIKRDEKLPYFG